MKFCNQCGKQLNGEKFCTRCGAKVEYNVVQDPITGSAAVALTKETYKKPIAVAGVLALLVIVVFLFTGRGYKRTVKSFVNAVIDGNVKKVMSLMPDELTDHIIEEEYDGDEDDMISDFEDNYSRVIGAIGETDLSNVSFEIIEAENYTKKEVKELNDDFDDDGIELKIKEAKKVEVMMKIKIDGEEKEGSTLTVHVGRIGRSWYVVEL